MYRNRSKSTFQATRSQNAPTCGSFNYIVCAPKKGINLDATSESDFGDVN